MIDGPRREKLPDRRPSMVFESFHMGTQGTFSMQITLGFSRDARVKEIFCSASKKGSDLQAIIDDACIALSMALQCGMPITELAGRFGKFPDAEGNIIGPASVIGTIAKESAVRESELRTAGNSNG